MSSLDHVLALVREMPVDDRVEMCLNGILRHHPTHRPCHKFCLEVVTTLYETETFYGANGVYYSKNGEEIAPTPRIEQVIAGLLHDPAYHEFFVLLFGQAGLLDDGRALPEAIAALVDDATEDDEVDEELAAKMVDLLDFVHTDRLSAMKSQLKARFNSSSLAAVLFDRKWGLDVQVYARGEAGDGAISQGPPQGPLP
jgi:hypothetical protein